MSQETTIENVKAQLMYEWDEQENEEGEIVEVKGKQLMTDREATVLIEKHKDIFEKGQLMRSYAYYTANQIRAAHEAEPVPRVNAVPSFSVSKPNKSSSTPKIHERT